MIYVDGMLLGKPLLGILSVASCYAHVVPPPRRLRKVNVCEQAVIQRL